MLNNLQLSGKLMNFYSTPLSLVASYNVRKGGRMMGYSVDEKTLLFAVSYPIWKEIPGNIGYKKWTVQLTTLI